MMLEQLRIFVAVAQQEHFTRVARQLGMSQSSVSAAIAALEGEFKLSLFDRSRRSATLTRAGDVLLAEAENILRHVDTACRRMNDLTELRAGRMSIAASQTIGNYWLPGVLSHFRDSYPGIIIDLWIGNSTEAEMKVSEGSADIAIIEKEPISTKLRAEVVSTDNLVLVVGPNHYWFHRDRVDWPELTQTSWVMREPGSGTRSTFEAALATHGISPAELDCALMLRSGDAVRSAVLSGRAAAVISYCVAEAAIGAGLLRRLEPLSLPRNYYALSSNEAQPMHAVSALFDVIRARTSNAGCRQEYSGIKLRPDGKEESQ
jgi:DNA-binding transcriptional LysR family regulator